MPGPFSPPGGRFLPGQGYASCGPVCDPWPDGNTVGPVIAPATYWTPDYVERRTVPQGWRGGDSALLQPTPIKERWCRPYWHVSICCSENLVLTAEAQNVVGQSGVSTVEEKMALMAGAKPSSQLKVKIQWPSAHQDRCTLICDLGSGIEMTTPPATFVEADLLVPSPQDPPVVPGLVGLLDYSTVTVATARATPEDDAGFPWTGRYTQTRYIPGPGSAILDEIPAYARWVDIYVASPTATDPPDAPGGTVTANWVFDTGAFGIAPIGLIGTYPGAAPGNQDSRVPVPQNAKYISLSSSFPVLATLVYGLAL